MASYLWWTRTQRIRTVAQVSFEVALLETAQPPAYQRIALQVKHLRQLGFSLSRIARQLGVTDKTVAKAVRWMSSMHSREADGP